MQTNWMAALALAMKAGVAPAATLMSLAALKRIAVATAQLKTRIQWMVAFASVPSDGKVIPAKPR